MKKLLLNLGFILTAVWIALIIMEGKKKGHWNMNSPGQ